MRPVSGVRAVAAPSHETAGDHDEAVPELTPEDHFSSFESKRVAPGHRPPAGRRCVVPLDDATVSRVSWSHSMRVSYLLGVAAVPENRPTGGRYCQCFGPTPRRPDRRVVLPLRNYLYYFTTRPRRTDRPATGIPHPSLDRALPASVPVSDTHPCSRSRGDLSAGRSSRHPCRHNGATLLPGWSTD